MDALNLAIVAASGLIAGAIMGASIGTETERKIRGEIPRLVIFPANSLIGICMNQVIELLLIAAVSTALGFGILWLGSLFPLVPPYFGYWGWFFLAGVGLGKWLRYRYWKRRDPWSFD